MKTANLLTIIGTEETATTGVTGVPNTMKLLVTIVIVCILAATIYLLYRNVAKNRKTYSIPSLNLGKNSISIYKLGFAAPVVTDNFKFGETIIVGRATKDDTSKAKVNLSKLGNFIADDTADYRKLGIPTSDKIISREQLTIFSEFDGNIYVTPGSRTKPNPSLPIYVNGTKIPAGESLALKDNDVIYIGEAIKCKVRLSHKENRVNSDKLEDDATIGTETIATKNEDIEDRTKEYRHS